MNAGARGALLAALILSAAPASAAPLQVKAVVVVTYEIVNRWSEYEKTIPGK